MKILPYIGVVALTSGLLMNSKSANAQTVDTTPPHDTFEKSKPVLPSGTTNDSILLFAPSPEVLIQGELRNAKIVVDLSKNILYYYNEDGIAQNAYLVASGKPSSPTHTGVRVVSHTETFPYKTAPYSTKRRRRPWDYGPKIIIVDRLNPETGEKSQIGEFIHGNNNPESIGHYASMGCIRMDNEVIKDLSSKVKRGDIIVITKSGKNKTLKAQL